MEGAEAVARAQGKVGEDGLMLATESGAVCTSSMQHSAKPVIVKRSCTEAMLKVRARAWGGLPVWEGGWGGGGTGEGGGLRVRARSCAWAWACAFVRACAHVRRARG